MEKDTFTCAEAVAYKLMRDIALLEGKSLEERTSDAVGTADRKWVLDTYAECLKAIWAPDQRLETAQGSDPSLVSS